METDDERSVTRHTPQPTAATMAFAAWCRRRTTAGRQQDEIVLGSIQDLSGPLAGSAKQALGMMLRVDEINEQGGINGRKIKLLVEDRATTRRRRCWRRRSWSTRTRSS